MLQRHTRCLSYCGTVFQRRFAHHGPGTVVRIAHHAIRRGGRVAPSSTLAFRHSRVCRGLSCLSAPRPRRKRNSQEYHKSGTHESRETHLGYPYPHTGPRSHLRTTILASSHVQANVEEFWGVNPVLLVAPSSRQGGVPPAATSLIWAKPRPKSTPRTFYPGTAVEPAIHKSSTLGRTGIFCCKMAPSYC